MYKIKTYNKISKIGLQVFDDKYTVGDEVDNADGAIVRSAALHDTEFPTTLKAIDTRIDNIENDLKEVK